MIKKREFHNVFVFDYSIRSRINWAMDIIFRRFFTFYLTAEFSASKLLKIKCEDSRILWELPNNQGKWQHVGLYNIILVQVIDTPLAIL